MNEPAMADNRPTTILLADSSKEAWDLIIPELVSAGYTVDYTDDGVSAVSKSKDRIYDIIIVDHKLPDMTGLQVIKEILTISKETVPIIVSDTSSVELAVESMRLVTHDYLLKPVALNDLLALVNTIVH